MNTLTKQMLKVSGRSWWQCRYSNGRVLSEWDTLTGRILLPRPEDGGTSRWEDIDKKGMIGLRLICPNGMVGELEAPEGCKFFQLKVAVAQVAHGSKVLAHIIGVVENANGNCLCRAWDPLAGLIEFRDNIYNFQYQKLGMIGLDVQGLKL